MKKEIPTPAIIAAVVVLVAIVGFFLFRAASGDEIKAEVPKSPNFIEGIPAYVKEGRPPTAEEAKAAEGMQGVPGQDKTKAPQ